MGNRYSVNQTRAAELFSRLRAASAQSELDLMGHIWRIDEIQALLRLDFNRAQKLFFWLINKRYFVASQQECGYVLSQSSIRLIQKEVSRTNDSRIP